ncbi:MAG: MATE family efflux transporter [Chitinophagales bacterium]|nr:MATE family efflux transporter [Chitinophagales bacterium]
MKFTSYRNIINIAWPIMLGSLGQNVIYLVDTAFIGRVSEYDLGASAMGGIFYFLMFMIGYAMNTGMQVVVARRKGEHREGAIGEIVDQQLYIILAFGVMAFLMFRFFSGEAMGLIVHSEEVRLRAVHFLNYRSYGIVFGLLNSLFMSFFIGIGNTRVTTWTTGVMVVVNIFFLSVLVFGKLGFPRMEIAGAGLASTLAEISVTIVILIYLYRKRFKHHYRMFEFERIKFAIAGQLMKLSAPLVFQQMISVGSWYVFFLAIEHLGSRPLAVSNLIRSLYTLYGVPVWALASTTNSMVSNLMGQKNHQEVIPLIKKISLLSISFAVLFAAAIFIAPSALLSIFTNDGELIAASYSTLPVVVMATSLFSFSILCVFAVSGTGATNISFLIEVVCIVFYLVYVYFTAVKFQLELPVIWMAEVLYWIVAFSLCAAYLRYGNWRTKQV